MGGKYRGNGDCCFFTALLGTVILLSFLFIFGVPKFVIALEYWNSCPVSPLIPVYLCLTGLLGVVCVGHSAFLWACLYRRHMTKKASHDCCLVVWLLLMSAVPISQLIGGPFIIHMYNTNLQNSTECDDVSTITTSPNINQSSTSTQRGKVGVTIDTNNTSETPYILNPKFSRASNKTGTHRKQQAQICHYCNDVLMTCAYVTSIFELTFMTLPSLCLVAATVVFRVRNKETG